MQFVLGVAGVINPPSDKERYGFWTAESHPVDPEDWLEAAIYHAGSWWPHWMDWLERKDRAKRVPARDPKKGALTVIEDAPGTFVHAP